MSLNTALPYWYCALESKQPVTKMFYLMQNVQSMKFATMIPKFMDEEKQFL